MKPFHSAVATLWLFATAGFVTAGARWATAGPRIASAPATNELARLPGVVAAAPRELVTAAATVIERDLFRLDRRPATVAFLLRAATIDAASASEDSHFEAEPPYRPLLVLAGIVGGPPWEAILEGVPGQDEAVVVRQGDVVDRLRIRHVGLDSVIVVGPDTAWTLTLKREWHP